MINNPKKPLPIYCGNEYLCSSNIIYVEALSNYSKIHLTNGRSITLAKTLKSVEELLTNCLFYRLHNSCLVNLFFVDLYKRIEDNKVNLSNGEILCISRRKRTAFLDTINKFRMAQYHFANAV